MHHEELYYKKRQSFDKEHGGRPHCTYEKKICVILMVMVLLG